MRIQDESILKEIDGSFNGNTVPVKIIPMISTSGDTGIKRKVFVGISVDTLPISSFGAWVLTGADSFVAILHGGGVTDPFEEKGTVFAAGSAEISNVCSTTIKSAD